MMDFLNTKAAIFLQEDYVDVMEWLTCSASGDLTVPKGDVTPKKCPDPRRVGRYNVTSTIQGDPGSPTVQLMRPLRTVRNHLLEIECDFNMRINWADAGERTNPHSYNVAAWLRSGRFTEGVISNTASQEGDDAERTATSGNISGSAFSFIYRLNAVAGATSLTGDLNDICFLPSECATASRDKVKKGWEGWYVGDGNDIRYTNDGSLTWNNPTATPFTVEDLLCCITLETISGYRLIVGRGTAAGVAQIAYSDDEGATWTQINVGAIATDSIFCLAQDAMGRLWAGSDSGVIYRSTDQGASWTTQFDGTGFTGDINDIRCHPTNRGEIMAVGGVNEVVYSTNGETFTEIVGPELLVDLSSCDINAYGHWFVTTDEGAIYRSSDNGDNWEAIFDLTTGDFSRLRFDEEHKHFGMAIYTTGGESTMYRTEDGGNSWITTTIHGGTPDNSELNAVFVIDANVAYAVGEAHDAVCMVIKFEPAGE